MGILQDEVLEDVGNVPTCFRCGSAWVARDSWAYWNPASGLWELETAFDDAHCHVCERDTKLKWVKLDQPPILLIRELNDQFRSHGRGRGSVVVTVGVQEQGPDFVQSAMQAVRTFNKFSDDNDPWGEHDFGAVDVAGEAVFWKIDYFAPDEMYGSENPANEGVTVRLLTIMLAGEY